MTILKPFKGIRPSKKDVKEISSLPYDVMNRTEARNLAKGNDISFLNVIKPEICFPDNIDEHDEKIYPKGFENFKNLLDKDFFKRDEKECYYIYAQTMEGRTQYGLVGCAGVKDYEDGIIKKHELTRNDKEEDRMKHVRLSRMNYEPVFFTYRANNELDEIISNFVKNNAPEYDFVSDDNFGHHFWVISDDKIINRITEIFKNDIECTYVADGHHRTAAAALVGKEFRKQNKNHSGNEEYNYFLAVHFPDNQLKIIDYNRLIKDLNGNSVEEFINKIKASFNVELIGEKIYKPEELHTFSMYIENNWYKLTAKDSTYNDNDPIAVLDVTILTKQILEPILDIQNLRTSKKIDFVGGIRGLDELKKRVDSGEMKAAFALYPVTMKQLMDIADNNMIMPPKTTWFEPKLRSGLVVHEF